MRDPYAFWERQRLYDPSGASCGKIVGNFFTFLTDPDAIRKVRRGLPRVDGDFDNDALHSRMLSIAAERGSWD